MLKEEKVITLRDGNTLHADIVETGAPVWLIITHGLGEHSGRHAYIYKLFSQYFNICLYDLRGHGKSSGKRAYVSQFSDYCEDLDQVIDYLSNNYSMKNYQLIGHSMGGLITASYLQGFAKDSNYPQKVFLSAPASSGAGMLGKVFNLAPMAFMQNLTKLPLTIPLKGILDISKLSHDPRVFEAYINDDLNCLKVHTKLFTEILYEARRVFSKPLRAQCELYCALGSDDHLVGSETTINYFKNIEKNAQLKVIEGGYHELHNEIEKYRTPYLDYLKHSIMSDIPI